METEPKVLTLVREVEVPLLRIEERSEKEVMDVREDGGRERIGGGGGGARLPWDGVGVRRGDVGRDEETLGGEDMGEEGGLTGLRGSFGGSVRLLALPLLLANSQSCEDIETTGLFATDVAAETFTFSYDPSRLSVSAPLSIGYVCTNSETEVGVPTPSVPPSEDKEME